MVQQQISITTIIDGQEVSTVSKTTTVWPQKIVICPIPTPDGSTLADAEVVYQWESNREQVKMSELPSLGIDPTQADAGLRMLFDAIVRRKVTPIVANETPTEPAP